MKGIILLSQQLDPPDPIDLALRLMDDDQTALDDVLRHYGKPVMDFLVMKHEGMNEHDAEDILAISINKLWDARHSYDESKASLRTWFFQIAHNTALDVYKSGWAKANEQILDFVDIDGLDMAEEPFSPNETKRQKKDRENKFKKEVEDLKTIIDGLSHNQREIIMSDIYARDQVTEAQVLADELGTTVGNVRVARHRAWKKIRSEMKQLGYELPPEGDTDGQR